jgi:hypothetical protein
MTGAARPKADANHVNGSVELERVRCQHRADEHPVLAARIAGCLQVKQQVGASVWKNAVKNSGAGWDDTRDSPIGSYPRREILRGPVFDVLKQFRNALFKLPRSPRAAINLFLTSERRLRRCPPAVC